MDKDPGKKSWGERARKFLNIVAPLQTTSDVLSPSKSGGCGEKVWRDAWGGRNTSPKGRCPDRSCLLGKEGEINEVYVETIRPSDNDLFGMGKKKEGVMG